MRITNREYSKLAERATPPSPKLKNCVLAFCVGGLICTLGQLLFRLYQAAGLDEQTARTAVSVTLIFLTAALTGLHVFDKLAKFAGAGTLVPITGFANAVVSPAIEFKAEGHVMGIGAKMFTVAGPVLVYGIGASAAFGLILWIFRLI